MAHGRLSRLDEHRIVIEPSAAVLEHDLEHDLETVEEIMPGVFGVKT